MPSEGAALDCGSQAPLRGACKSSYMLNTSASLDRLVTGSVTGVMVTLNVKLAPTTLEPLFAAQEGPRCPAGGGPYLEGMRCEALRQGCWAGCWCSAHAHFTTACSVSYLFV